MIKVKTLYNKLLSFYSKSSQLTTKYIIKNFIQKHLYFTLKTSIFRFWEQVITTYTKE